MQHSFMNNSICSNHEECEGRHLQLRCIKNFTAKEFVKGHPASSFVCELKCDVFNIDRIYRAEFSSFLG